MNVFIDKGEAPTASRCEPLLETRDRDGLHYISVMFADGDHTRETVIRWIPDDDGSSGFWWNLGRAVRPVLAAEWRWTYLGPVPTWDEVARLRRLGRKDRG